MPQMTLKNPIAAFIIIVSVAVIALSVYGPVLFATPRPGVTPTSKDQAYTRMGTVPSWGHDHSNATTGRVVLKEPRAYAALTDLRLFGWGEAVRIEGCTEPTVFCLTQSATVTIASNGYMYDGTHTSAGAGSCFRVGADPDRVDLIISQASFPYETSPGRRNKVCTGGTDVAGEGRPCVYDVDCSYGATCEFSAGAGNLSGFNGTRGAFLKSIDADGTISSMSACFISTPR